MYTYDDIVTAKDILTGKVNEKDVIGKKGWLLDCIPRDMSLNVIARLGVHVCLTEIDLDSISPFGDGGIPFTYFLPEKEESAPEPAVPGTSAEKIEKESYEERQDEWLKANDIAGGDKVRIVRRAESHEDGWDNTWTAHMDDDVGKVGFVVEDNGDNGIRVDTENGCWSYPYFVLEKVKDEPACIPFDLSKPEDRDALRDKWVKSKNPDVFHEFKITQFIRMNDDHQTIYVKGGTSRYSGNDLFSDYTFFDGSVIGKPANGQQIRRKHD